VIVGEALRLVEQAGDEEEQGADQQGEQVNGAEIDFNGTIDDLPPEQR